MQTNVYKKRIRWVISIVILAGLLVIGRLFQLQILQSKQYKEQAEHQYLVPKDAVFDRGNIYFTAKDGTTVAAATISSGFKIAVSPKQVTDPEALYTALSKVVTTLDHSTFISKFADKTDSYEEVANHLDQDQANAVLALNLPKVSLVREKWRSYPGGTTAAQTIGFVSYKDNSLIGRYGLEGYYNDVLSRTSSNLYVNFFAEIFANINSTLFKNETSEGDLVTTIEPTVQTELETVVNTIQQKYSSDSVGAIVMDPYTGEIIAMAHTPSFDPNTYASVSDIGVYKNPFAQDVREMGSIVKPVVMASALDAGVVTPQTSYFDKGYVVVKDRTINNFDHRGRGHATMQDVLNQSLNTGMVFVEQKMGQDTFRDYLLNKFKIGDKTGIDLPGEVSGLTSNLKSNNDVNFANAAFGQGISLTPLEIVRSFSALANGGYLVTPHLVKSIQQTNGLTKTLEYAKSGPIISAQTDTTITNMLIHVVDDGYHRGLKDYTVAAKTGTAQVPKPGGGGYYTDRNLHSMIGFFPATNPRFVVYFYNLYPKGAPFAIQSLGDSFFGMIQFLAGYYNISPDR